MITSATEADDHPQSSIFRISLSEIKEHDWVTMYGLNPLLKEEENCQLIEVRILEKLIEVSLERLVEMKHNFRKAY